MQSNPYAILCNFNVSSTPKSRSEDRMQADSFVLQDYAVCSLYNVQCTMYMHIAQYIYSDHTACSLDRVFLSRYALSTFCILQCVHNIVVAVNRPYYFLGSLNLTTVISINYYCSLSLPSSKRMHQCWHPPIEQLRL